MGTGLQSIAPIKAWEAERAWAVTKDTTTIAVLEEFVRSYGDDARAGATAPGKFLFPEFRDRRLTDPSLRCVGVNSSLKVTHSGATFRNTPPPNSLANYLRADRRNVGNEDGDAR